MDEHFRILADAIETQDRVAIRLGDTAYLPSSYVHSLGRNWNGKMMVTLGTLNGEYHAHVDLAQITELEVLR